MHIFSNSASDFSIQSWPVLAFGLGLQSQSRPLASTAKTQSHPVPSSGSGLRPQSRPSAAKLGVSFSLFRHCVYLGRQPTRRQIEAAQMAHVRHGASAFHLWLKPREPWHGLLTYAAFTYADDSPHAAHPYLAPPVPPG